MSESDDEEQGAEWEALYEQLSRALAPFGKSDAFGEGDYWIVDDNYGPPQHKVYFWNLAMLKPEIVDALRASLREFPDWEIVVAVDVPVTGDNWPNMGLIIRKNEIVDGLQRQYFPPEYQSIQYEGSRVGTDRD
jgi:hypothetical protein